MRCLHLFRARDNLAKPCKTKSAFYYQNKKILLMSKLEILNLNYFLKVSGKKNIWVGNILTTKIQGLTDFTPFFSDSKIESWSSKKNEENLIARRFGCKMK